MDEHKEFLLGSLRAAVLRAKLMEATLTSIGVALKNDLLEPDMAVKWVHDEGLMFLLGPLPGTVGAIALQNLDVHVDAVP